MERTLEVRTGESIAFEYELAGLGSRFLALLIDLAIQVAFALAIVFSILFALSGLQTAALAILPHGFDTVARATLQGVGIFAAFVLFFGYFIAFELAWSGRTPGKRALGIRVVRDAGFPIDLGAAVIRNLVRVLEFAFAFYAVAAISALISPQNKRLGDIAAGTIVVRDRAPGQASLDAYLARERRGDDGLDEAQRALVDRYIARRARLDARSRVAIAGEIATRIRPSLRASFAHLDDDELLVHLGRSGTIVEP